MTMETEDLARQREAIKAELQQMKTEAAEKKRKFDFNNLWTQLPDGGHRWTIKQVKWLDKPMHERGRSYAGEVSELSYNTTWQQYFDLIDATLENLGKAGKIDLKRLAELQTLRQNQFQGVEMEEIGKLNEEFNAFLELLYIELRLKGFSDYDLWQ